VGHVLNSEVEPLWVAADRVVQQHRNEKAFIDAKTGDSRTFAEVQQLAVLCAQVLRSAGIREGQAVGLWAANGVDWFAWLLGASRIGATTIPLNVKLTPPELHHLIEVSDVRHVVTSQAPEDREQLVQEALCVSSRNLTFLEFNPRGNPADDESAIAPPAGTADSFVVAFSTTGSTGLPKLAVHTQGGLVSHHVALGKALEFELGPVLAALPFCGVFGFTAAMAAFLSGTTAVVLPSFGYREALDAIARWRVRFVGMNEAMGRHLLRRAAETNSDLSSLELIGVSGTNVTEVVASETSGGPTVLNLYGSSETFALSGIWRLEDPPELRGLAGGWLTCPGAEVRVSADDQLEFRGPNIFQEYLGNPGATSQAFTADGWFKSGDIGRIVDVERPAFEFLSREGDELRMKGYLVSPAEIELAILEAEGVEACAVVGVRNERFGTDDAVAFVVQTGALAEDQLQNHAARRLAEYKLPLRIITLDAFPTIHSANGDKLDRRTLRTHAQELIGQAS